MTNAQVKLLPEAVDDLRALDGSARKIVLGGINKLRTDPEQRGAPLGSHASGNLTGFRKLVVGNRAYRIVYRVHADGTVAVVWVIGQRADSEVYDAALARLAQYSGDPEKQAALRQLLEIAFE